MTPPRSSPDAPPRLFDGRRRQARLARSRRAFGGADFLHRRAADGVVESLNAILKPFDAAVDLSPHSDVFAQAWKNGPAAERLGQIRTLADPTVPSAPGDSALGLPDGQADLIVSILGLHAANDLPGALAQIRRALRPDGLFVGALFGAGTLQELRVALTEAELHERGGAQARVFPFADAYDAAGLLQRAGFALPVADLDTVVARYPNVPALIRDLRAMGETNALAGPIRPLSRAVLARTQDIYAERFADADGRLRATFQIIQLAGWAPHESQQKPLKRGSATHSLAAALNPRQRG